MKRLPKKVLVPLVLVGLAVAGFVAWRWHSGDPLVRALDEFEAEIAETKAEFPDLTDARSLAASRVRGSNGWIDIERAVDLLKALSTRTVTVPLPGGGSFEDPGEDVLSTLQPHGEDDFHLHPELFEPPEGPARIAEALRLTEPLVELFKRAAEADCIVQIPREGGLEVIPPLETWRAMCGRITTLLDAGRPEQARRELLTLLNVAARTRTDTMLVIAMTGRGTRGLVLSQALRANLERLPRPESLLEVAIRLFKGRQPSIRNIVEGEMAYFLSVVDDDYDPIEVAAQHEGEKRPSLFKDPKGFFDFVPDPDPEPLADPVFLTRMLRLWIHSRSLRLRQIRRQPVDARDSAGIQRFIDSGGDPELPDHWDFAAQHWKTAGHLVRQDLRVLELELRLLELRNGKLASQKTAVAAAVAKVKGARLEWDGETAQLWLDHKYEIVIRAEWIDNEDPYIELKPWGSGD